MLVMMSYLKSLFQGRINRRNYLAWVLVVYVVLILIADFIKNLGALGLVLYLLAAIFTVSAAIRRLHDINKSGWIALLLLIPLVNLILMLFLIFKKGSADKNKYGQKPNPELNFQNFLKLNK